MVFPLLSKHLLFHKVLSTFLFLPLLFAPVQVDGHKDRRWFSILYFEIHLFEVPGYFHQRNHIIFSTFHSNFYYLMLFSDEKPMYMYLLLCIFRCLTHDVSGACPSCEYYPTRDACRKTSLLVRHNTFWKPLTGRNSIRDVDMSVIPHLCWRGRLRHVTWVVEKGRVSVLESSAARVRVSVEIRSTLEPVSCPKVS